MQQQTFSLTKAGEDNFFILLHIANSAGLNKIFFSSTSKLSRVLGYSQQSISRKLRDLEKAGLVERSATAAGIEIKLTSLGVDFLKKNYEILNSIFSPKTKTKQFSGTVQHGLGEGKFFLGFSQYVQQILDKLNFSPYQGTLNLKIKNTKLLDQLQHFVPIYIEGFATKERNFGGLNAYKVLIENLVTGALIFPERSNLPKNIIELISPVHLRKKLNLKDGDKLKFSII